ncbi:MAG: sodium/solute symporter [Planctomycetaceae bacterium]|nr:sodium/solute symporter [Planctomycetaceae bacterium]
MVSHRFVAIAQSGGLAVIDWAIIVVYASATIGLGYYYSRQQSSTEEYFVGSGKMNPFLVGVSLFATLLSTISYLSMPGESLAKGPINMTTMLALPLVYVIVAYVLLPVYMRQKVTSAYELLEAKLGLSVRLLGAFLFVLLRLVWMSLLVYLTAKAMTIMLGVGDEYIPVVALVTGFIAVIYTSMGGLRAVIITDLMQTILLYGGALIVLALITFDLGGFGWFPTDWKPTWDTQPLLPSDLSTRVTVLGSMANFLVWYVCTAGGDQTSVQRFMATEDVKAARRAFATQLIVGVIVGVTLGIVGFALLGYFEAHPEFIPSENWLNEQGDDAFPHFIAYHLPVGLSGLVVSAMFAAAMSSIDSGVNSITAVVMTDGFDRLRGKTGQTEKQHVNAARWLAFGIGAIAIVGSSLMGWVPGNITSVTSKTSNLLTTPIFGLFFYALFVPFATPLGAWVGTIVGTITAVLIAFSGPIFGTVPGTNLDPISFQWIAPAAITVNIITGCLVSLILPSRTP